MSPVPVVEPPPQETLEREESGHVQHVEIPARLPAMSPHQPELFSEALLEMSKTRPTRRTLDFFVSLFVHFSILAVAILLPLYFTDAIDMRQFSSTLLVAPPPPPPPPPPPAVATIVRSAPRRVLMSAGKLVSPVVIPDKVAMLKEEALPPDLGAAIGVEGGVPGGVPGGQAGGVIGGIIGGIPKSSGPPPPPRAAKGPVRVGGRVREPQPISTPQPAFPVLARQAKIQGDVVIDAVIDTGGNVVEMKVVSGHPLLINAALEALRNWKYQPTFLNDEPIPVALYVTIRFRLQ